MPLALSSTPLGRLCRPFFLQAPRKKLAGRRHEHGRDAEFERGDPFVRKQQRELASTGRIGRRRRAGM